VVTLHRPSNVDDPDRLEAILSEIAALARSAPIVFPVHPRTRARLAESRIAELAAGGVQLVQPLGYLDFLSLELGAAAIITDSGGVQEEASALGVRCYTLRPNTERPVTLTHGTNVLLGDAPEALRGVEMRSRPHLARSIPKWDGHAGERVADVLVDAFAPPSRRLVALR
jgi:UDP-N-acetylglucosamine 2-epimerase (non-hydrolysing)